MYIPFVEVHMGLFGWIYQDKSAWKVDECKEAILASMQFKLKNPVLRSYSSLKKSMYTNSLSS